MSKTKRPEPESLELAPVGVDSHAHLDLEDFDEDREELVSRAEASGLSHMINVFLGPDAYEAKKGLFDAHPNIYFLLGIHPNDADKLTDDCLARMEQHFKEDPRLVGVGEIGLDYYWDRVDPATQKDAFIKQLDLARRVDKPVIIHSRDANDDTMAILLEQGFKDYPILWHCFGAGIELAEAVVDAGWHISIPGPVTFRKKSDDIQAAVARIPFERLLIETDCPYLTPEPWRGKRNHPALVGFTAQRIAQIKGRSLADIWQLTGDNARAFFGIE